MNVNRYSYVEGKVLNINRWAFTLLHIKWDFVYKLQTVKFHHKYAIFGLIENLSTECAGWASSCLLVNFLSNW